MDKDYERECRSVGAVFWMLVALIYFVGLVVSCLAGYLIAGGRL